MIPSLHPPYSLVCMKYSRKYRKYRKKPPFFDRFVPNSIPFNFFFFRSCGFAKLHKKGLHHKPFAMLRHSLIRLCSFRRQEVADVIRLYAVTDDIYAEADLLRRLQGCVDGGSTCIQVRLKHPASTEVLVDLTKAVVAYARPRGVKVLVDDRADVCVAADADGVHVGEGDLDPRAARLVIGENRILGVTVYGSEERANSAISASADYVGTGAIFGSKTKASAAKSDLQSLSRLHTFLAGHATPVPLVAIGGITAANAPQCFAHGADGVAMVSGLLGDVASSDPYEASRRLASETKANVLPYYNSI